MATRLPATERYSRVAIAFHWTIAVLVIFNLIVGIGHDAIPALRSLMGAHTALGLVVLLLTVARVAWRLAHRPPPLPAFTPDWERGLAHATHWALYVLLLAMPLTGWAMVSRPDAKRPFEWFGLFDVPRLPINATAVSAGHEVHEILGWMMLALVLLHIAAALRHHLILRDSILLQMLPATMR